MLEKEVLKQFELFNKRRLENKYNSKNIKAEYYLTSCGDQFFRNEKKTEYFVKGLNLNENKHSENVFNINYHFDLAEFYKRKIDSIQEKNIILFKSCELNRIPFIFSEIEFTENFSNHLDFHAMLYNQQTINFNNYYIWFLYKWVKIEIGYEKLKLEE